MVLLTYTLRQWQLWKFLEENLANLTPEGLAAQLRLLQQWIVIYRSGLTRNCPWSPSPGKPSSWKASPARSPAQAQLLESILLTPVPNPAPSPHVKPPAAI